MDPGRVDDLTADVDLRVGTGIRPTGSQTNHLIHMGCSFFLMYRGEKR